VGILLTGVLPDRAEEALNSRGEALYRTRCASCHEGGVARAPDTNALRQFRPERMSFALMFGMMSQQGRDLSQGEIRDIVRYLVGASPEQQQPLPDSQCGERGPVLADASLPRWNGWGVDIAQHRFQPAAMAQLSPDNVPRLKLKWAFGFPGDTKAYAQPTVWGGRVFVGSAGGKVYALDARLGCQRWCFTPASAYAPRSPSARMSAARPLISAINAVKLMRSMRRAGSCCGRDESMRMREP